MFLSLFDFHSYMSNMYVYVPYAMPMKVRKHTRTYTANIKYIKVHQNTLYRDLGSQKIVLVSFLYTIFTTMPFQESVERPLQKVCLKDLKLAAPFSYSISRVPSNASDRPAFLSQPFLRFFDRSYISPTWPTYRIDSNLGIRVYFPHSIEPISQYSFIAS